VFLKTKVMNTQLGKCCNDFRYSPPRNHIGHFSSLSLLMMITALAPLSARAVQINFTGGTVTRMDATTETTNNNVLWDNVDYYEEGGFKLDFIGNTGGGDSFAANIGNYYGAGNDVIHGHWGKGSFGDLTQIKVTKADSSAFDLNYFVLTSNTETGGSFASGNERAFIHASIDGINESFSQLLPSEDWGFPATQIFLGSEFDGIKSFWFTAENKVDCFGMDNFFINEPAPGTAVPGPLPLLGVGAAWTSSRRLRKRIKKSYHNLHPA
jgi:hypothetical protein